MRSSAAAAAVVLSASIVLAACGGDDSGSAGAGGTEDGPRSITVATSPIADYAPLYLGVEQGFFEDHGLTVEYASGGVGTETIASVLSGSNQFAGVAVPPLLVAQGRGLKVSALTPSSVAPSAEGESTSQLLTTAGSGIDSVDDLAGKTIAVNAVKAQAELLTRLAVEQGGGDLGSLQFVEIPFAEMPAALQRGDVDAIAAVEPFINSALSAGAVSVAKLDHALPEGTALTAFFTSAQLAESDPEMVEDFKAAMTESLEYAAANPDAVRAIIPEYTQVPAEVAAQIMLPTYGAELDRAGAEATAEAMQEFGFIDEVPDLDAMLKDAS
jgi:NitT/TauT family transport system substrate-binding protein